MVGWVVVHSGGIRAGGPEEDIALVDWGPPQAERRTASRIRAGEEVKLRERKVHLK